MELEKKLMKGELRIKNKRIRVNEKIYADEIRLIDNNKNQVGVVKVPEALRLAEEANLALVEISPKAKPPVCKIMDFGKYKYEEKKKAQQARKNHHVIKVKELRMRPNIGDHDLENNQFCPPPEICHESENFHLEISGVGLNFVGRVSIENPM